MTINKVTKEWQPGDLFGGEIMTCCMCGKQQKSDPAIESQWTLIEADGVKYYVCPTELPGERGSAADFRHAYKRIFKKIGYQP